jgi:Ni,Fe-hydrogenase III small subunit
LTRHLVQSFGELGGDVQLLSTVTALRQQADKRWLVAVHKAEKLTGHAVLVGFDALGQMVGRNLLARGLPFYVLDERRQNLGEIEHHMHGGLNEHLVEYGPLSKANLKEAQWLITTIPSTDKVKEVIAKARAANPKIRVVVCTCSAVTAKDVGKVQGKSQPVFVPGDTGAPARIVDMLLDDCFVRAREA